MKERLSQTEIENIAHNVIYNSEKFRLDNWQKEFLDYKGNINGRNGRQTGKSSITARKSAKFAINYPGITILMIAAAQRQSSEIFEKTLGVLYDIQEEMFKKIGKFRPSSKVKARQNEENRRVYERKYGLFAEMPTKTEAKLNNGTRLLSLPTGKTGAYIRCYTIDILIGDEAAFCPEPVWVAVLPMLAVSRKTKGLGFQILISTPFGKGGYFYHTSHDSDFKQFHISSEQCKRIPRDFLRKEKLRLSKREYAQEYLAEFIDEFNQFFPTALIKERMSFITWERKEMYDKTKKYYLGLDIARYGKDENAFVIAEMQQNGNIKIVKCLTTERKSLTDTVGRTLALHEKWNFRKIFTDDSGVGGGVTDMLIEKLGKNKVHGINNSTKREMEKIKGIMKEDLYSNALVLMEQKKIDIIADLKLQRSLKCMQFEYTNDANLKISGNYSHLCEAFVRACWASKAKGLKLFCA